MVDTTIETYNREKEGFEKRISSYSSVVSGDLQFPSYPDWVRQKIQSQKTNPYWVRQKIQSQETKPSPIEPGIQTISVVQGEQNKHPFNPFQLKYIAIGSIAMMAILFFRK